MSRLVTRLSSATLVSIDKMDRMKQMILELV